MNYQPTTTTTTEHETTMKGQNVRVTSNGGATTYKRRVTNIEIKYGKLFGTVDLYGQTLKVRFNQSWNHGEGAWFSI